MQPVQPVPGTGRTLPPLVTLQRITGTLPYPTGESIPLYEAPYYATEGSQNVDWTGPRTVASISSDRRVALFALPAVSELSGNVLYEGEDGGTDALRRAIRLILEGLTFPQ